MTLKIRTGWDKVNKNALNIARIAEDSGIQALSVHGRTRADAYSGEAEYETIAEVKSAVSIPVIANGDITSPQKAKTVLDFTNADGLMIGRAAQGNPWIFGQIKHFLETSSILPQPENHEISKVLTEHLNDLYSFYGELSGVRIARKHIGWYIKAASNKKPQGADTFRQRINQVEDAETQLDLVTDFFNLHQIPIAA